jgi:hypothetical protein
MNEQGTPEVVDNPADDPAQSISVVGSLEGFLDENASLTQDLELRSVDGMCVIQLAQGVQVLTEDNYPLQAITIQRVAKPPEPGKGYATVGGAGCGLGPEGAKFSPPIALVMALPAGDLPKRLSEKSLTIMTYDPSAEKWVNLESAFNEEARSVETRVSHFSMYAIMGKVGLAPAMLGLIIASLIVEISLVAAAVIYFRGRKKPMESKLYPEVIYLLPPTNDYLAERSLVHPPTIIDLGSGNGDGARANGNEQESPDPQDEPVDDRVIASDL